MQCFLLGCMAHFETADNIQFKNRCTSVPNVITLQKHRRQKEKKPLGSCRRESRRKRYQWRFLQAWRPRTPPSKSASACHRLFFPTQWPSIYRTQNVKNDLCVNLWHNILVIVWVCAKSGTSQTREILPVSEGKYAGTSISTNCYRDSIDFWTKFWMWV